MPKHYVYILQCKNGAYYTGYTTDLDRRMKEHAEGKGSKYVRAFVFKKLIYSEIRRSRTKALQREAEIKTLSRKEKEAFVRRMDQKGQKSLSSVN